MKLIDEKGRLFGNLNLIDLHVIVQILAVGAAVCWKLLAGRAPGSVSTEPDVIQANEEMTVRFTVRCSSVDETYLSAFDEHVRGASLVRDSSVLNGKVLDYAVEPSTSTQLDAEGNSVLMTDQDRYDVVFTVEYTGNMEANALTDGDQLIRIGQGYVIRTVYVEVTGYVTDLEIVK